MWLYAMEREYLLFIISKDIFEKSQRQEVDEILTVICRRNILSKPFSDFIFVFRLLHNSVNIPLEQRSDHNERFIESVVGLFGFIE